MKGAVAAGDRLTALAAAEVLRIGGNAFDGAVAAAFAAPMAEPALTSAGGGGFLLAISPNCEPTLYDFFVDVPPKRLEEPEFFPITVDFKDAKQVFHIGMGSVAVPGFVAGLLRVHQERGKLPLREVLSPAMEYAKNGVYLSPIQASFVKLLEPIFTATEEARKVYAPEGKLIDEKSLFKNPDYGEFLELLCREGLWAFYEGEVADEIDKLSRERGGLIRKEDLERYKVAERPPLKFSFKGKEVLTNPPPSSGGILIAFTLKLLEKSEVGRWGSTEHLSLLIESLRATSLFREEFIDGELHREGISELIEKEEILKEYANLVERRLNLWGNTTHVSILDGEGNGVSMTTTNGEGSGVVIPGTGVMLNNMLGEEDLNPKGFFKWPPYTRLPSMMAPTGILKEGKVELLLGSAGSNRIRSAIVQVILNYEVFKKEVKEAVELPRVHYEKGEVFAEPGFPKETLKEIAKLYPLTLFSQKSMFFGGVQAVNSNGLGAGDPRRGGYFIQV
ncbi:gamma-glutamyltransferase family protein [Thermovibrio sp.]